MENIEALKAEKNAEALIAISQDKSQNLNARKDALAAIDSILSPASYVIYALERLEKKGERNERYQDIADRLGGVGYVRIINHLKLLLADTDVEIRNVAAQSLGHVCSKKVVNPLIDSLETDDGLLVRFAAILALNDLFHKCRDICDEATEQRLIYYLEKKKTTDEDDVRQEIADALGALRSEAAIPVLIKTLDEVDWRNNHDVDWVLDGRKSALAMIGSPAVEPLVKVLKNEPNMKTKMGVAWVLGEIRDERAATPLQEALAHITGTTRDNSLLKWYIKRALGKIEPRKQKQ
jgi:HEAT repeat protein